MMALNLRLLAVIGIAAAALIILATTALAVPGGTRPGWGNGDDNHTHTGPPGGTSVRPGNGNGDTNHTHTGPPGQS